MRALITGITGFVGTHLTHHLLKQGDQVLGCSRSARWRPDRQRWLGTPPPTQAWDVTGPVPPKFQRRVANFRPEVIFHLAAVSVPADCGTDRPTASAQRTNVGGTQQVLELAATLPEPCRLVLTSSCHVYDVRRPPERPVDEDYALDPEHGYGQTKLAAERLLQRAIDRGTIDGLIVRGFQQTGPLQSARFLLPAWARQFAQQIDPVVVRSVDTVLDLMDIRDAVRDYRELALRGAPGAVFNVGSGREVTGHRLLECMRRSTGQNPAIEESGGQPYRNPIADVGRLASCLGSLDLTPLEQTVEDTIRWWQTANG